MATTSPKARTIEGIGTRQVESKSQSASATLHEAKSSIPHPIDPGDEPGGGSAGPRPLTSNKAKVSSDGAKALLAKKPQERTVKNQGEQRSVARASSTRRKVKSPLQDGSADAAELQKLLQKKFENSTKFAKQAQQRSKKVATERDGVVATHNEVVPEQKSHQPDLDEDSRPFFSAVISLAKAQRTKQVIKTLLGLLLIVAAGWAPAARLFQVSSVEAIVNARVVTVRSPIEGVIKFEREINNLFDVLDDGALIALVENHRVDTSLSDDLSKQIDLELIEFNRVKAEQTSLFLRRERLVEQVEQYRAIRLKDLQTRLDEAAANQAEIEAKLARTTAQRERSAKLLEQELVAEGRHDEVESDVAILNARLEGVKAQRRRVELEYETLATGGFFGDSFNDRIRPATQIDATDDMLLAIDSKLNALSERIGSLKDALVRERNNLGRQQQAKILLPVTGRVWESLVTNREQVSRGQPLLRMLDCSNVLVTTAVSEEVYNQLTIGDTAKFILRDSNREFVARVTQLSGVSSASANLAILPSALEKEPYRATVKVPELDAGGQCLLGKTGRVVFDVKT